MRLASTLIRSVAVGALGGILFGFDTAVIAGTLDQLTAVFALSPKMVGVLVSVALWGTVAGCFMAGPLGQRFGSRTVLRLMALFYVISAIGCAFAPSLRVLMIARFIGGLGIGGSSVLGPVYIAEIAPAHLRGRLVGTFQINIVIGILLAYVSNWWIAAFGLTHSTFVPMEWRWQLGVAALPAVLFFIMLYTVPQSSRFLITQNSIEDALSVLREMGSPDPQTDLDAMREAMREEGLDKRTPLFRWSLRWPIFLAVSIGVFNQVSGINAILYYANQIFAAAGLDRMSGFQRSIFIGLSNLVATFIAMVLIDRLGRKTLLLIGAAGTAACLIGVGHGMATGNSRSVVWLIIAYIGFFALSQGAVIWVYIAEVFPTRVRSKGQSLGSGSHWVTNAIVQMAFPYILATFSKSMPFYLFAGMCILQFVVVLVAYPETKGKTLEQIQMQLERR